jgi:heparanase 1
MDTTLQLARAVVAAVRAVNASVEVWAGEIGPHNGEGGPGDGRLGNCSGNLVCGRFGSTLWYADSLASKAVAGYAAFCRQDFIGADYGLVNFTSLAPATDFWLLVLWKRLMGARVLSVTSPAADPLVRTYAFCGARAPGTAVLLFVHLGSEPACVDPPAIADPSQPRTEYALTPTDGTVESAGVALNGGNPLQLGPSGQLPPLPGRTVPAAAPISLAPLSVTFVELSSSAGACSS